MDKARKWVKAELKVEVLACTHILVMLFVYAIEKLIVGTDVISFWLLLQMSLLGYWISWFQQLLFLKEKVYSKAEYRCRGICWWGIPPIVTMLFGQLLQWFGGLAIGYAIFFYIFMLVYYVMAWYLLQYCFREESKYMNEWLDEFKQKNHK